MNDLDQHVYPASEESLHQFDGYDCLCGPNSIVQGPDDGIVFVHRRLSA